MKIIKLFMFMAALAPALIVGIILFKFTLPIGGLSLLVLTLINRLPASDEDFSRIEHKLDSIAKVALENHPIFENYRLLHRTAWEHEVPMDLDIESAELGKERADIISNARIASMGLEKIYYLYWIFMII